MFHACKPILDRIDNIHAIERTLYSEYLSIGGRVDCIAEFDGEVLRLLTSKLQNTLRQKSG